MAIRIDILVEQATGRVLATARRSEGQPASRLTPMASQRLLESVEVDEALLKLSAQELHEQLERQLRRAPAVEPGAWETAAVEPPSRSPEEWLPPEAESYATFFQFLSHLDRGTLSPLAAADPIRGYAAMLWTRSLRALAAKAIQEELAAIREGLRQLDETIGTAAANALWDHVTSGLRDLAETLQPNQLTMTRLLLDRIDLSSEWIGEILLAERSAGSGNGKEQPKAAQPPSYSEQEKVELGDPVVELFNDPDAQLRDHHYAGDGHYWAGWTCVDWPGFISTWPAACIKPASTLFGDYPTLTETPPIKPPALKYPPSTFTSPQSWVSSPEVLELAYLWDKRVKNYLPALEQIHFFPTGQSEILFQYTLVCSDTGFYDIDWDKLIQKLKDQAEKFGDKVVQRIIDTLKGAKIDGFSLDPLVNAASAAKDGLTALIETILSWLLSQLSGAKFPPLSITHKIEWVIPKGAKIVGGVFETVPRSSVYLSALDKDGKLQPLPAPSGMPAPLPGQAQSAILWEGESKLPDRLPATTLKTLVQEERDKGQIKEKSPIYWLPNSDYGLHALVPLHEDQKQGSGEYWVAVRTEVRKIRAVKKK